MTTIVDYGVGNLFSLYSSLSFIGENAVVTADPAQIRRADRIILPGVGAFADAAAKLFASGLVETLREETSKGKPLLGICLGMQLLFEKSYEFGEHAGLGFLAGNIRPIADVIPGNLKVPQIGWNALAFPTEKPKSPLFSRIQEGAFVYFVHSFYAADCEPNVIATTEYGAMLTAAAADKNVYGVQFHPEKSGETGMRILQAFCEMGVQA